MLLPFAPCLITRLFVHLQMIPAIVRSSADSILRGFSGGIPAVLSVARGLTESWSRRFRKPDFTGTRITFRIAGHTGPSGQCFVGLSHGLKHRRGPYRCDHWDQRQMAARGRSSSCQRRLAGGGLGLGRAGCCRRLWDVGSIGPYCRGTGGAQDSRSDTN